MCFKHILHFTSKALPVDKKVIAVHVCFLNKVFFIWRSCHGSIHDYRSELFFCSGSRSFLSQMSLSKCLVSLPHIIPFLLYMTPHWYVKLVDISHLRANAELTHSFYNNCIWKHRTMPILMLYFLINHRSYIYTNLSF